MFISLVALKKTKKQTITWFCPVHLPGAWGEHRGNTEKRQSDFLECSGLQSLWTLHKKWSFAYWISAVNVTKSAVLCGSFGWFYRRNL